MSKDLGSEENDNGVYYIYVSHKNSPTTWKMGGVWDTLEHASYAHKTNGPRDWLYVTDKSGPIVKLKYEKREPSTVGNSNILEQGELNQRDMRVLARERAKKC